MWKLLFGGLWLGYSKFIILHFIGVYVNFKTKLPQMRIWNEEAQNMVMVVSFFKTKIDLHSRVLHCYLIRNYYFFHVTQLISK
jgi:hypothetical protein